MNYQETTVDGVHHRYPELFHDNLVVGKVIFICQTPPESHDAEAALETRREGAGQRWAERYRASNSHVPRPKEAIFLRAHCDWGTHAYWRVHVWVQGTGRYADGGEVRFDEEDFSLERRIACPGRR